MSAFDGWAKFCHNNCTEIWPIYEAKNHAGTGLYMTKTSYEVNHRTYYHCPVYQVWIDGERDICVMNKKNAVEHWKRRMEELGYDWT